MRAFFNYVKEQNRVLLPARNNFRSVISKSINGFQLNKCSVLANCFAKKKEKRERDEIFETIKNYLAWSMCECGWMEG
jgi:hypothetical protein